MITRIGILFFATIFAATSVPLFASERGTPRKITVTEDSKFAALASTMQARGYDFDQIFAEACRIALVNVSKNPKLRLDDQVRSIFGGLWQWTRQGGNPVFQGRNDLALHFIGGGAFEGYFDVGRSAAVIKEQVDTKDPNNVFDLDDMAATMLGARWVDIAVNGNPAQTQRWVELWARGQRTLSLSIPHLNFGRMPKGEIASKEAIQKVRDSVDAALVFPEDAK